MTNLSDIISFVTAIGDFLGINAKTVSPCRREMVFEGKRKETEKELFLYERHSLYTDCGAFLFDKLLFLFSLYDRFPYDFGSCV